ncbi:hypothetical protein [Burkholderia cenocepacia]|uniref:Uncharacterized protein n=1 Tax=Burkholderia cenocepacia TaxID=95486 RepID=A0ABD4U4E1_9BURK|nr:hypothetical protein [Burkholderia cenocepacia]MCW3694379.1 hypothetical protein [Burkholderia cenocepacia]MCW3709665.1 hypothetical protein [Burkholderia cenocepacia]MCW3718334.1 hypothetical protein [Burkholderia cenocepacia]MCW3726533.1 hypothetical protein [Burkholderia cenocepacia]MDT6996756.1 hypothetical protein [Burkholderia cenocepacia]
MSDSSIIERFPLNLIKIFHPGALMIKGIIALATIIICGSACAESTCADIRGQQNYPPLNIGSGSICFIQEPVLDPKTKESIGADAISLYYIANGGVPVKAEGRGLLYDDTPGKIVDAFSSSIDRGHTENIFVIHSMNVRSSLVEPNSSGKFYSVSVFDLVDKKLRRDERASEWFGADYSWLSDGRNIIYKFPYQSRNDVLRAIDSQFSSLMSNGKKIPVVVNKKSYLFDDSSIKNKTRKYLIKGDHAVVEDVSAGWCRVNYSSGKAPLDMWIMCATLDVASQ